MTTHFVVLTGGSYGDVLPFIEIGKSLLKQQHKCSVMTNPCYESAVASSGLSFVPFGVAKQLLDAFADPGLWNPKTGFRVFWKKVVQPNLHCLRSYVRSLEAKERVVVLCHPAFAGVADLARAERDLKIVQFYLYPTIIRSYFNEVRLGPGLALPPATPTILKKLFYGLADRLLFDVPIVAELNKERTHLGLKPIKHLLSHLQGAADLHVTLFPEWYAAVKPDYPQPLIAGNFVLQAGSTRELRRELLEFLDAGPAPVLFTASTANVPAQKLFETAVDVIQETNERAIFVTKFKEQVPARLPGSVLWQEYAAFNRILPRVSAIVHYGGVGTLAEACRAGVPQLILPWSFDQFDNASIISRLGIGSSIPARSLTSRKLLRKLLELQRSEKIKKRCRDIAANFATGVSTDGIIKSVLAAV